MARNRQRGRRKTRKLPVKSREEKMWEGGSGEKSCKTKANKHLDLATQEPLVTLAIFFHYEYSIINLPILLLIGILIVSSFLPL